MTAMSARTHEKFLAMLWDSADAVFTLAAVYHRAGWDIAIPGLKMAPDYRVRGGYRDKCDLRVRRPKARNWATVEVKATQYDWQDALDWPHGKDGKEFFIDSCSKLDDPKFKPKRYVVLNRQQTVAAIVDLNDETRQRMKRKTVRPHRHEGPDYDVYYIDPCHAHFCLLDEVPY